MVNVTDAQLEAAEARGRKVLETEPRASPRTTISATGRVTIDLVNGCAYVFPAQLVQDLHGASHEALAQIEVDGLGLNLHWPALDADLYVPALVSGIFGTRAWMTRELARVAGGGDIAGKDRRGTGERRERRTAPARPPRVNRTPTAPRPLEGQPLSQPPIPAAAPT